ncbi:MAG TPA: hypothetical protein VLZ81_03660 [Blastocatellia bacterium]|nr:hypothetical protein [Blastocatellia bacterium]
MSSDPIAWDKRADASRNVYPGQAAVRTDNQWNYSDISKQIDGARVDGLLDATMAAASANGLKVSWPLAIASRESNMRLTALGDKGAAYGPWQQHPPTGVAPSQFYDPDFAANYTCQALARILLDLRRDFPGVDDNILELLLYGAWNRGERGEEQNYRNSPDHDPSQGTAFNDYPSDTRWRRLAIDDILGAVATGDPGEGV